MLIISASSACRPSDTQSRYWERLTVLEWLRRPDWPDTFQSG